ncbi:spinster family MFS transporter [Zavarzinia sp. CC-PAN008]|uniref:spinster family MFS transporter n=1 Tax=Zavarzinia sp. CC-PAN008 TaxID=3243332 RepID=UPI003F748185
MSEGTLPLAARAAPAGDDVRITWSQRYVLIVLMLVYTVSYIDRQILSILLQPIKEDLGLSDTSLGFLSGITFALFYAGLGVPIAMLSDRFNRRNIIAVSLALFSGMTAVCGLAQNFWQLALARVGVGVGEAGTGPASHSMIADMFPPQKRAAAMGFYSVGINLGILIGFLAGGWLSQEYGWRTAFMVVGLPGLFLAVLVFLTVREPVRGQADRLEAQAKEAAPKMRQVFGYLWQQRSFRHLAFGSSLAAFAGYGGVTWIPAFLSRSFQMTQGDIGEALALIIGIVGGLGTFLTGWVADRMAGRDIRWYLWTIAATSAGCFPFGVAMYLADNQTLALILFCGPAFSGAAYVASAFAITQALSALRMRAAASAIYLLIINMIGMGLGPQTTGILSDLYEPTYGQESLRYALLTIMVMWPWAALHFYLGARTLEADIDRARAANG